MTIYRYKLEQLPAGINQNTVGASFTVDSMSFPTYVDVDIVSSSKEDLDALMLEAGYVYDSAPAGGAPNAAEQWALDNPSGQLVAEFRVNGVLGTGVAIDGAFLVPPGTYQITDVQLYRRTAGSSGSTIVDVMVGTAGNAATTIYDSGSRPTVDASAGDYAQVTAALPDAFTGAEQVVGGDRIEMDVDAVEAGTPVDLSLSLTLKRMS